MIICIALTTSKSIRSYESRIVNGKNASEGQFPYQASLYLIGDGPFCGASIVSNRFLLTAAHCSQGRMKNPNYVYAIAGNVRLSKGIRINLDKITPYEGYDAHRLINDISLIRTAQEIIFTDSIQPIALPKRSLPNEGSTQVVLSGWGTHMVNRSKSNSTPFKNLRS